MVQLVEADQIGRRRAVVLPVRVDPSGEAGPTKRAAAGEAWRRSSRGRYVPASVLLTPMQRVAEAGVLLPTHGAVTGWAALSWARAWWFSGFERDGATFAPVPIAMSTRVLRPQSGLLYCNERWDPRDVAIVDGLAVTSAARSAVFAMRYARNVWDATSILDMAAFHDEVSIEEASIWIDSHPSYTGIEQARQGRNLADENAWSPREHAIRLVWEGAGFPRPLTNRPVFDLSGRHIGTPDVIDPGTGVMGEYDGPMHLVASRRAADLRREHEFREHGLEPVTMVGGDVSQPGPFIARLAAAYARVEHKSVADRQWTMELPHWWVPTFTVDQRRRLDETDRQIWLRNRQPPDWLRVAG